MHKIFFEAISSRLASVSLSAAIFFATGFSLHAVDKNVNPNDSDIKPAGPIIITPIDKMMAINNLLGKGKMNWKSVAKRYKDYMDVDSYDDKNVLLPVLMGMRMSDGVLSIMARDVEVLNAAAEDIESMATKLGVDKGQLQRANRVKSFANKNKWNRVFMELGFLQKDVMDTMAKEGNKDRRSLLIAAGWIQGAEMLSSVILPHYSDDTSSLLREPLLVKQMIKEIENLKADKRKDPITVMMLKTLKELVVLVDVPLNAPISKENIQKIHDASSAFVRFVLGFEGGNSQTGKTDLKKGESIDSADPAITPVGIVMITPITKMMEIDNVLEMEKVNWKSVAKRYKD